MSQPNHIGKLLDRRAELRAQGRTLETIPIQEAIVEASAGILDEDQAHNYLSTLYLWAGRYVEAEARARTALELCNAREPLIPEKVGCYEHVLSLAIAAQGRYTEAAPIAEAAIRHYREFHDPPDDFLNRIMVQAREIRRRAEMGSTQREPAPIAEHRDLFVFFREPDDR